MTRPPRHALVLLLALAPGCVSFSPPIRTGQYGAPGRMEAGMVEAAGNVNAADLELSGGPMVGYGITDAVSAEAGAEASSDRAIGYLGIRYTPLRPRGRSFAFTLDLESGGGAGVGGQRCVDGNCDRWAHAAGGGYLGVGIGGKIKWFSPWLRLRTQASLGESLPITSLTTAMAGVQFSIANFAHIYLGSGGYLFANENTSWWGLMYVDGGLSFTIPTARTRRIREQQARVSH